MDPLVAIPSWLCITENGNGHVSCNITTTVIGYTKINCENAWRRTPFWDFLRMMLKSIGVGSCFFEPYSGQSIKVGHLQLYRSLGIRDEMAMEIIQMSGNYAYLHNRVAYNDCALAEIPRFTTISECFRHGEQICNKKNHLQCWRAAIVRCWNRCTG